VVVIGKTQLEVQTRTLRERGPQHCSGQPLRVNRVATLHGQSTIRDDSVCDPRKADSEPAKKRGFGMTRFGGRQADVALVARSGMKKSQEAGLEVLAVHRRKERI